MQVAGYTSTCIHPSPMTQHGSVYSRWFLAFNTGQFISPFVNQRTPCSPPFCQKSALAVVQALIGCNKAACRTKQDRSYSFHMHHLRPLYSLVTLCSMALSLHTGKFPQNLLDLLLGGVWLWLSPMSAVALTLLFSSCCPADPLLPKAINEQQPQ